MEQPDRPLNVTDALSYLDAVKIQFQDQPDVYNHFLDIMKDFKSQAIDTPGVIERVSTLFTGNPYLIQGFNTFLPPGYRIDISADPLDFNTITVTTPMGTITQTTSANGSTSRMTLSSQGASNSRPHTPSGSHNYDQYGGANYSNPQAAAAATFLGNLREEKQPAEQFNHAITYLNKIKNRFADDPNVYKQFLEILQTYQKEQKHLMDSQVYAQVQVLFKDAPELLTEFKDFLPSIIGGSGLSHDAQWSQMDASGAASADTSVEKRAPKRRRKPDAPAAPAKAAPSRSRRAKPAPRAESPTYSTYEPTRSPPSNSMAPPPSSGMISSPTDRLMFFERAKKVLEPRDMYDDFLKLLNMFAGEVIDSRTLIDRAKPFLGEHGQLMGEFMEVIGWFDRGPGEGGPPGSIRTGPPEGLLAPPTDLGQGPSYRRLPESEVRLACSGRDELCRSVLNDLWVSHPTWASEEAGFLAHKKNSFEEALHKSEEERHEYQIHLEAINRTISLFQPICERIEEMSNEERAAFRLPPDFGGASKSIYYKIIKKVYGRDAVGNEVIQALQESPSNSIPVVLNRLKQKDEEWRRAHRDWSKTWREVDTRNFYKSLDYQIITFKANDKKAITAKHFVADIQAVKQEQVRARDGENYNFIKGPVGPQLQFSFEDTGVLQDAIRLVCAYLEHSSAQFSSSERRAVEGFLRSFIPMMCMVSKAEFNNGNSMQEGGGVNGDVVDGSRATASRSGRRTPQSPAAGGSSGVAAVELRKRLLMAAKDRREQDHVKSRTASPTPPPEDVSRPTPRGDAAVVDDVWVEEVISEEQKTFSQHPESLACRNPFFTNTTFYTLLRLIQLLYSRLLICKQISFRTAASKYALFQPNNIAVELGLDDPNGPAAVLAQAREAFGNRHAAGDGGVNVLYLYLLDACEKLFDGEMDQTTFEEHMRWFFKEKAYHVFTIDKLIAALIKQVQTVLSDNKCQELWTLLKLARSAEALGNQDIVRYRREAERHLGQDDQLYKVVWESSKHVLRITLIGQGDPSVSSTTDRFREYVDVGGFFQPKQWLPMCLLVLRH
ncbi:hypothetical protein BDV98DRAFT_503644 [Pterulicium gracile]|uniref:Histone deacetylase interacting domain-containing protein n=1 Tax=Pterulicium gracile TaxID=1884261 RepID=A0A5C3QP84_9AGAR|nr:hypothetical protein BDV98DRAFT_503644 [Pterula gracilis]